MWCVNCYIINNELWNCKLCAIFFGAECTGYISCAVFNCLTELMVLRKVKIAIARLQGNCLDLTWQIKKEIFDFVNNYSCNYFPSIFLYHISNISPQLFWILRLLFFYIFMGNIYLKSYIAVWQRIHIFVPVIHGFIYSVRRLSFLTPDHCAKVSILCIRCWN